MLGAAELSVVALEFCLVELCCWSCSISASTSRGTSMIFGFAATGVGTGGTSGLISGAGAGAGVGSKVNAGVSTSDAFCGDVGAAVTSVVCEVGDAVAVLVLGFDCCEGFSTATSERDS